MMKRTTITIAVMVIALCLPMAAAAMSHENQDAHGKAMAEEMQHHGDMQHDDQGMHKGHDMDHSKQMSHDMHMAAADDGFVEIGKDTKEGVVATVKVKAYDEAAMATMKKMGMDASHHVMVFFSKEQGGAEIAGGKVALKVRGPAGQAAKPVMMMLMGNGFGGDVTLKDPGMYTFELGTKLEDGNKRQFEVGYHNM